MNMLQKVYKKHPLIDCITNNVTINDCANILLACGASPTMARNVNEVGEIAAKSGAVVLNLGAIEYLDAMIIAGIKANQSGVPVVFDPVAAGASQFRRECCEKLLFTVKMAVIRGNVSEIKALLGENVAAGGVDVAESDLNGDIDSLCEAAKALSRKTGAVVVISGETDVISDGERTALIKNGCAMMARITGSGCMLTSLTAGFCAAQPEDIFTACVCATAAMGLCGEIAFEKAKSRGEGTGSFRTYLIDAVSLLDDEKLNGGAKIEFR
ncbi:MAG: hydroxyethylthiazole kinase [Oscillospiraceae bacterium]|nr:hydroxyethylthiazole kinase [Oscillospiraceae bacterium]